MAATAAAISAITAIAANLYNQQKGKELAEAQDKRLAQQRRKLSDWYNRTYYADPTQRADVQRLITRTQDTLRERSRAAAGRAAVMGGTEEGVAAEKEANSRAVAEMMGNVAAANDARKDAAEQRYMEADMGFDAQAAQLADTRAMNQIDNNIKSAQGVMDAAKGYFSAGETQKLGVKPANATTTSASTSTTGTN